MEVQDPFHSSRLSFRTLKITDDIGDYLNWMQDAEITEYLESRFDEHDEDSIKGFISGCNSSETEILLGIFKTCDGMHIGNIKLGPIDKLHSRATIGLLIGDKSSWGCGYATEAIQAVSQYAISSLNTAKIDAGCYQSNIGSKKAFESAGYNVEGFLESHVNTRNGREGCYLLGLTA